jgi:hypothetical protein
MADDVEHCPFLNRSDARCSENFNIDHLRHAFRFCFGRYKACTTYVELLVERRIRRNGAAAGRPTSDVPSPTPIHGNDRFVQLTVSAGHALHAARAA